LSRDLAAAHDNQGHVGQISPEQSRRIRELENMNKKMQETMLELLNKKDSPSGEESTKVKDEGKLKAKN